MGEYYRLMNGKYFLAKTVFLDCWWGHWGNVVNMVLIDYPGGDFQSVEKPKGGPLEIENFFVEGEGLNERGWRGSGSF